MYKREEAFLCEKGEVVIQTVIFDLGGVFIEDPIGVKLRRAECALQEA